MGTLRSLGGSGCPPASVALGGRSASRLTSVGMIDINSLFPGVSDGVYLNTASMALGNRRAVEASAVAMDQWQRGEFDFGAAEKVAEELRVAVASLIGASVDDMAIVTGASGSAATVAAQLPPATRGENVVVPARDFLSNFMAWAMLRDRGYELRLVEDFDGLLSPDSFAKEVDGNTAIVATSLVQSASGFRVDVEALKAMAHDSGAWLVLDASQAMGAIDIDVEGIAALFACSHKWLLGVRGMGHLYLNPELHDRFAPLTPGWKSTRDPVTSFYGPQFDLAPRASKLDASFGWFDAIANIEGLRIIESVGIEGIEAHNMSLVAALEDCGIGVAFDQANRSPIVSIDLDDPEKAIARLGVGGIVGSLRAGKIRVSLHLYNSSEDVEALAEALT